MEKLNKFFNLKFKWRFGIIVVFLILCGFLIYNFVQYPAKSFLSFTNLFSISPKTSQNQNQTTATAVESNSSGCEVEERPLKVQGNSLTGLIEDGAVLKLLMGYYKCQPVNRDDLIVYNYPGRDPLIKIAKGIPGDKFQLKKSQSSCWNILINDKILKNSESQSYCISEQGNRMLSLYEKDYKGVIPQDAYLILGNEVGGTLDSTRFGLVGKNDFLGKAQP